MAQIRELPSPARYGVVAAGIGAVAVHRLRLGAPGLSLAFVVVAAALAVWYGVRPLRSRLRG